MSNLEQRNEESQEIAHVGGEDLNWLAEYQKKPDRSAANLDKYRILPRIGIAHGVGMDEVVDAVGLGSACIPKTKTLIALKGQPFSLVPVFGYTEYIHWRDRRDKSGPHQIAQTFDPTHEIAIKSQKKDLREKEYPGSNDPSKPFIMRYCEHVCIAAVIYSGDQKGAEVLFSFSRGEYKTGSQFANQITGRRLNGMPVHSYLQVWTAKVGTHDNSKTGGSNKWFGFDFEPAEHPGLVAPDEAPEFEAAHNRMADAFEKKLLRGDYEGTEGGDVVNITVEAEGSTGIPSDTDTEVAPQGDL
jgi:hypothetical protein